MNLIINIFAYGNNTNPIRKYYLALRSRMIFRDKTVLNILNILIRSFCRFLKGNYDPIWRPTGNFASARN